MRRQGALQIQAARADGRWDAAYALACTIEVPDDLRVAFDAHSEARDYFQSVSPARP